MLNRVKVLIFVIAIGLVLSISLSISFAEFENVDSVFEDEGIVLETLNSHEQPKSIFELQSKSAILVDASSGQVLFEKNCHEKLLPASITKIMPLVLTMEAIDSGKVKLEDNVTCSEFAAGMGGSQIWLEPGEQMTVNDLLKCIVIASANDATVALGEHIYGSNEALVKAMNDKAKKLGMNDTNFINATGLDVENHYTSAYDIAKMSRELINKHPLIFKYTTVWMDTVRNGEFGLNNTNKLVKFYKGCDGLKTGSTSKALFNLSATAQRNGLRLIAVAMTAPTSKIRNAEVAKLLDHGFANYGSVLAGKKNDVFGTIRVTKGVKVKLDCIVSDDARVIVKKGEEGTIERIISLEPKIEAPIKKGQKVGEVILKSKDKKLGKFDLVASESIDRANFIRIFQSMFNRWLYIGR